MVRILVVGLFLLISVAIMYGAFVVGVNTETGTLLVNLGTEIFGILITLAVVDWLLERRRMQERAREIAWNVLHSLERAVWVWQGGPRRLETDELLGLISGIEPEDPVEPYTRALLVGLGAMSREALDRDEPAVRALPRLETALNDLTSMHVLNDGESAMSIRVVSEVLDSSARELAAILGHSIQRLPPGLVRYRDSSREAQQQRFYDVRPTAEAVRRGADEAREPESRS